jgi:meso-butanediol dehydrogenase / (S,S)-butanediol dehydrogenase / diacetyl reductase
MSLLKKIPKTLLQKTVGAFGKLDILINNAAAQWMGTVLTAKSEDYDYLFSVNVKGYGMCAKYAIPYLRQSDDGVIVNVSSVNGVIGMPGQSLYNVTKAAIIELSKSMAIDFPELRINAILPGFTKTAALDGAMVGFENEVVDGSGIEEGYRLLSKGVLRKRIAEPIEIAKAILFLASSDASYITGSTLLVDGGIAGVKNPGRDLFADPRFSKVFGKVLGLSWLTGEDK